MSYRLWVRRVYNGVVPVFLRPQMEIAVCVLLTCWARSCPSACEFLPPHPSFVESALVFFGGLSDIAHLTCARLGSTAARGGGSGCGRASRDSPPRSSVTLVAVTLPAFGALYPVLTPGPSDLVSPGR